MHWRIQNKTFLAFRFFYEKAHTTTYISRLRKTKNTVAKPATSQRIRIVPSARSTRHNFAQKCIRFAQHYYCGTRVKIASLSWLSLLIDSMKRNTIRDESSLGADAATTTAKWMYSSISPVFRLDAKFRACCSVPLIVISRQERSHRHQGTDATTAPNEGWSCSERAPSRSR